MSLPLQKRPAIQYRNEVAGIFGTDTRQALDKEVQVSVRIAVLDSASSDMSEAAEDAVEWAVHSAMKREARLSSLDKFLKGLGPE